MTINGNGINGSTALDEEAYQLWLRNPSAACIHLVELDYSGGKTNLPDPPTRYTYTLKLSDSVYPPYFDVIEALPSFSRKIGENLTGYVSASIGELILSNYAGALDELIGLNISGREVRIYHGDPSWSIDRFRLVLVCISEIVATADENKITIRLRAKDTSANKPIQTNVLSTTGVTANREIPLAYGTLFNVEPLLKDSTTSTYQWNDGEVTSISEVRDSGYPFQTALATVSAVDTGTDTVTFDAAHGFYENTRVVFSGTPPTPLVAATDYWVVASGLTSTAAKFSATRGGSVIDITSTSTGATAVGYHWTANLTTGEILLASKPAGQLTLDGVAPLSTAATILPEVLNETNLDTVRFRQFASDVYYTLGLYVKDRANRIDVAETALSGLGVWYGYSRMGKLMAGQIQRAISTKVSSLVITADMLYNQMTIDLVKMPAHSHRMGYKKNWTIQTSGLVGGVSEENLALFASQQSNTIYNPVTIDPLINDPVYCALSEIRSVIPSMISNNTEALVQNGRWGFLEYGYRALMTAVIGRVGVNLEIGDTVDVVQDRFAQNLASGADVVYVDVGGVSTLAAKMTIVGIDDNLSAGQTVLTLHWYMGMYAPIGGL